MIFHILMVTEGPDGIVSDLIPLAIAERADAERLATTYREMLAAGYASVGTTDQAYRSRVGILEITNPDDRLGYPPAVGATYVDEYIVALRARSQRSTGEPS